MVRPPAGRSPPKGGNAVDILVAIVLGVVAGLLMKALFLKESPVAWDVAFGAIGGLVAYYLATAVTGNAARYIATFATAVVVAGVLHELWRRLDKTA